MSPKGRPEGESAPKRVSAKGSLASSALTTGARALRGFAILEALVTIVLLSFGILGLVGLQAKMQAAEMESYQRSQALLLLEDMAARLNTNRAVAADYVTATPVGTGGTEPTDCSAKAVGYERDLCEWSNALKGSAETLGGNAVGTLIGGRGCIEEIAGAVPPRYQIVVTWQGLHQSRAPDIACATGAYGNEALGLRRAVVKVVAIADLTP
jgi:type IV pilus assembly protein PilV